LTKRLGSSTTTSMAPLSTPSRVARATSAGSILGASRPAIRSVSAAARCTPWTRVFWVASSTRTPLVMFHSAALATEYEAGPAAGGTHGGQGGVVADGPPAVRRQNRGEGADHFQGPEKVCLQVLPDQVQVVGQQVRAGAAAGVVDQQRDVLRRHGCLRDRL